MKRCPRCHRSYTDETLIYCLDDGTLLPVSDDAQATLVLPQARPTDPFPNFAQPTQVAQPQIVRQGVRPAVVYALVALLLMVIAGAAVALYYERNRNNSTSDAGRPPETPRPTPTATPSEPENTPRPTPTSTPRTENAGGAVPGKYPAGSTRLLTEDDVAGKTSWELKVMKNEIYARHGYIFKTPELRNYFASQPWYRAQYDDVADLLSNIEKDNAAFIKRYE